jgi:hypothetical protein
MLALQQLLDKRGQDEVLQEWDIAQFKNHADVMRFWSSQVCIS